MNWQPLADGNGWEYGMGAERLTVLTHDLRPHDTAPTMTEGG